MKLNKMMLAVAILSLSANSLAALSPLDKLYIDSQVKSSEQRLNRSIHKSENKANAGVASATAISNIPFVSGSDVSVGMGIGFHDNSGAMAAGVTFKPTDNGYLRFTAAHNDEGDLTIGSGFAFGF